MRVFERTRFWGPENYGVVFANILSHNFTLKSHGLTVPNIVLIG